MRKVPSKYFPTFLVCLAAFTACLTLTGLALTTSADALVVEVLAKHDNRIHKIAVGPDGTIWGVSDALTDTLERYNPETKAFEVVQRGMHSNRSLAVDRDGIVWILGGGGELWRFDPQLNRLYEVLPRGSQLSAAHDLKIDSRGVLWMTSCSHNSTLRRYDTKTGKIDLNLAAPHGIVTGMDISREGVWIVEYDGTLQRYDERSQRLDPKVGNNLGGSPGIPCHLATDQSGAVWSYTWRGVLHRFDPLTGAVEAQPTGCELTGNCECAHDIAFAPESSNRRAELRAALSPHLVADAIGVIEHFEPQSLLLLTSRELLRVDFNTDPPGDGGLAGQGKPGFGRCVIL